MVALNLIKNKVRVFQKGELVIIYLKDRHKSEKLYEWQHRLRVRCVIFRCLFHTYHSDMDFSLSLRSGWTEIFNNEK